MARACECVFVTVWCILALKKNRPSSIYRRTELKIVALFRGREGLMDVISGGSATLFEFRVFWATGGCGVVEFSFLGWTDRWDRVEDGCASVASATFGNER